MKTKIIIFGVVVLISGFLAGKYSKANTVLSPFSSDAQEVRNDADKYTFINPLLECENIENVSNGDLINIKYQVSSLIENKKKSGDLKYAAVYFRDLNNGPWFGINEKDTFVPGSLLKVPLVMTAYKIAERDPSFLEKEILYEKGGEDAQQLFPPEKFIEMGKTYTIRQLIDYTLKYSDNNAALILSQALSSEELNKTYTDLGIQFPKTNEYSISVRTYASFFRILFNSTFLKRDYSEEILKILTKVTFDKGLRAGAPQDVAISHKFGEREVGDGINQLHDCGVVYKKNNPYLLCVMTQGSDMNKLAGTIQDISKVFYDNLKK